MYLLQKAKKIDMNSTRRIWAISKVVFTMIVRTPYHSIVDVMFGLLLLHHGFKEKEH